VIEDTGLTTRDDLVHGFVGDCLPPVRIKEDDALPWTVDRC
jgi:hypothetical protein